MFYLPTLCVDVNSAYISKCIVHGLTQIRMSRFAIKKIIFMIKFSYTIFYVKDVVKSISFYEKAFGFKRKFIAPNNEYGELITGDTTLSFAAVSLAKTNLSA